MAGSAARWSGALVRLGGGEIGGDPVIHSVVPAVRRWRHPRGPRSGDPVPRRSGRFRRLARQSPGRSPRSGSELAGSPGSTSRATPTFTRRGSGSSLKASQTGSRAQGDRRRCSRRRPSGSPVSCSSTPTAGGRRPRRPNGPRRTPRPRPEPERGRDRVSSDRACRRLGAHPLRRLPHDDPLCARRAYRSRGPRATCSRSRRERVAAAAS